MLPEDGTKKVRIGGKVSTEKVKVNEHESGQQMRDAFEASKSAVKVEAVDEAEFGLGGSGQVAKQELLSQFFRPIPS